MNGIGAVVFGLWIMSQGTGPGESIMIVLGLPVFLVGVVLTIIGLIKFMKRATRDVDDPRWAIENDRQAPVEKPKAKKD